MAQYQFVKSINPDRLTTEIKNSLPLINFHLELYGSEFYVITTEDLSEEDQTILSSTVNAHYAGSTMAEIVEGSIKAAEIFGQNLMKQFVIENVLMGITQAGKTIPLTSYLHKLNHYITTGSLYAAIVEMDYILADTSTDKTNLYPFISDTRMTTYKHQVQTYLGVTLT